MDEVKEKCDKVPLNNNCPFYSIAIVIQLSAMFSVIICSNIIVFCFISYVDLDFWYAETDWQNPQELPGLRLRFSENAIEQRKTDLFSRLVITFLPRSYPFPAPYSNVN